ncbi:hypothetical protein V4V36_30730 [Paenibacillus lautus]|uniref:hypothetical protein n=1 Tax=Paenibacillus lautus TaxID=1401 RepID=UPI002FBD2EE2
MSVPVKPFRSQFTSFDYFIIGLTYVFFPLALIISFDYRSVSYFAHTAASQLPGKEP